MSIKRIGLAGLILAAGFAASACTEGYGYGGMDVGYGGSGYYGDPYGVSGYDGYGGYDSYGASYFGWYGDFYYPGTGIYVYDSYRRPYRWNNDQRRYWENRRNSWRGDRNFRNDWNGFDRRNGNGGYRDPRGDGTPGYQGYRGNGTPGYQGYRGGPGSRGDQATQGAPGTPAYQGYRSGGQPGYQGRRGDGYRGYRGQGRGTGATTPGAAPQAYTPPAQTDAAPQSGYRRSEGASDGGARTRGGRGPYRGRRAD